MRRPLPEKIKKKVEEWNTYVNSVDLKQHMKITLNFFTGRNGNDALPFDSVIAHYTLLYILQEDFFNLSNDHDETIGIRAPLWKVQFDNSYFYLCSWINEIPSNIAIWSKRFEKQMLTSVLAKRVSKQMGQYKSYLSHFFYSEKKQIIIWATGNIDLIKKILPNPMHVGKKHSIGFGQCSYEIEQLHDQYTRAIKFQNILQRPMPVEYCQKLGWIPYKDMRVWRPICPPYFGKNVKLYECYDGGTKLKPRENG